MSGALGILIALVIYKTTLVLNRLLPYKNKTETRLFFGLLTHFLLVFGLLVLFFFLYDKAVFNTQNFSQFYQPILIKLAIIIFILVLFYEVIYFAMYSYYSYATLQIETVKQERKQVELQLNALKSQLSPHFLFNSLNTISSLIYKNQQKAKLYIRKLATMYQYTLQSYDAKLVTVEEELLFLQSYTYLLQTRFEEKFDCSIHIADDVLSTKIPPLTLQILVENAVKHNVMSNKEVVKVQITSFDDVIVVENNLTQTPKNITSFNIGLKNINARYLLLFGKGIEVIKSNRFTVKIPVVR